MNRCSNGSKIFIHKCPVAGVIVVFAMTDKSKGTKGISAFIVPAGKPGSRLLGKISKRMASEAPYLEVLLKDCRIPGRKTCSEPKARDSGIAMMNT